MRVFIYLLNDGMVSPIRVIFCNVNYFPGKVVCS